MTTPTAMVADSLFRLWKTTSSYTGLGSSIMHDEAWRSALRATHPDIERKVNVGLGFIDAFAALMLGNIEEVNVNDRGNVGRIKTKNKTGESYVLSYNIQPEKVLFGGYSWTGGGLTYHAAMMSVVFALAYANKTDRVQTIHVQRAWNDVLKKMQELQPMSSGMEFWTDVQVRSAFSHSDMLPLLAKCADEIEMMLRLDIPSDTIRPIEGQKDDAVGKLTIRCTIKPKNLIKVYEDDDRCPRTWPASSSKPRSPRAPSTGPTMPKSTGSGKMFGPYIARILRSLEEPNASIFMVGPTATGKTTQGNYACQQLGLGIQHITGDPGLDASSLIGSFTKAPDGTLTPYDGLITRWARRAINGEKVVLFMDELARFDRSVVALIMGIMNRYSASQLASEGYALPSSDIDPIGYHKVFVWTTGEMLIVPASNVKFLGAANIGDSYEGVRLDDPAFRRRWETAWMMLQPYDDSTVKQIMAERLGIPTNHVLISATIKVINAVAKYQADNETLIQTIDLATAIQFAKTALRYSASGIHHAKAFFMAAEDSFLDRIIPMKGDRLDPDVVTALKAIVNDATPTVAF